MVAPTCDGEDVGEALVAHNWASSLSERHNVTLLTYHQLDRTPAREQLPQTTVVDWTEPAFLGRFERLNSMMKPGYAAFYRNAKQWISDAIRRGERFDVGFQPTPVSVRYPSPMVDSGLPYVLGPIGGSIPSPLAFREEEGTAPIFTRLRTLDSFRLRHDRWLRRSLSQAQCVLGIGDYVRDVLREVPLNSFEVMSDVGLANAPPRPPDRSRDNPVRLLFVGRLVRTKGARDAIASLDHLRDLEVHLDIVGDGPDREACEALTKAHGLNDRVSFHGWLPRSEVDLHYRSADVFVFPSYREPGGSVVFEAMGHGLPLIVTDQGGPGTWVQEPFGVRITPTTPDAFAVDIARAIRRLVEDATLRHAMGEAARTVLLDQHLWHHRREQLEAVLADAAMCTTRREPGSASDGHR